MENTLNELMRAILGGGVLDVNFLVQKLEEFDLDAQDVVDYAKEYESGNLTINGLIYATFNLAANNFLDKVVEYAEDNELSFDKDSVEVEVYTNYLDSFLNGSILNYEIDVMDYSDENLKDFIGKANTSN
ncbi:MAG: hypothetical protein PHE67_00585 [Campylobacterales bacterium]|nr:hypothetical protein [Campylobacterales bacterium]